ncbi:formyl transferase domain protein [Denitrovibrio acetiphilus DSM 12809]|uniref:phosphoribosylglycinamide formyltransferase 1 n=1 Tax=Denitrovibrio acetiphilus (strain DSM 12809 / NBRC 114555 / N2460) TaxID=522772 RepID=D4H5U4_DENA2|nr:formyltransferase family protein [Denitrovibrio acetiphilus]ADD69535.1 formyl transferase domain protein [Denitrovibrio acetiphilus DSM 12809]
MKICFLASGGGGNFKFFKMAIEEKLIKNIELFLIADRECGSSDFAQNNDIYCKKINYRRSENKELLLELEKINPDIIVTNWHKIIDEEVVKKYYGKLINLHYSLLPAFDGLIGIEPIKQAYGKNCKYAGTTCHYVDEGVDSGKIISQALLKTDISIDDAIQEIFQKGCLILLNTLVNLSNEDIIEKSKNNKFEYSPNLLFNENLFDDFFWKRLSEL